MVKRKKQREKEIERQDREENKKRWEKKKMNDNTAKSTSRPCP